MQKVERERERERGERERERVNCLFMQILCLRKLSSPKSEFTVLHVFTFSWRITLHPVLLISLTSNLILYIYKIYTRKGHAHSAGRHMQFFLGMW